MLIKDLIPESQYSTKCPYFMTPKGICIHNTANDASAKNERNNVAKPENQNEVSFHIAIDDEQAIQLIPFNRNTWHAGDGGSGEGNRSHISIEICYSRSGGDRFIKAEQRTVKEVALLLKQYGWGINQVKKHQDFSGKYCPHRTLDMGWQRFLNMVQAELNGESVDIPATPPNPTPQPSKTGSYLYLKPHVTKWNVYPTNVAPVYGNECGVLAPTTYGGLEYEILGNPQTDVYTIQTLSFGIVNIYVPKDGDSEFYSKGSASTPAPKPEAPKPQPSNEYIMNEYSELGVFTCTVDAINFRNKPYVGNDNPIQGQYYRNETVHYDYVVITNKYTWISWVSASSGIRRYMPITDRINNEKWGYCV
jgi:N-acetylmuramoyl-L-alanine amidase/Bacterial SH3 domain